MWHVWNLGTSWKFSFCLVNWKYLRFLGRTVYIKLWLGLKFQIRFTVNFPRHDAQSLGGWECIGWNHSRHRWYHLHSVGLLPEECPAAKIASDLESTDFVTAGMWLIVQMLQQVPVFSFATAGALNKTCATWSAAWTHRRGEGRYRLGKKVNECKLFMFKFTCSKDKLPVLTTLFICLAMPGCSRFPCGFCIWSGRFAGRISDDTAAAEKAVQSCKMSGPSANWKGSRNHLSWFNLIL